MLSPVKVIDMLTSKYLRQKLALKCDPELSCKRLRAFQSSNFLETAGSLSMKEEVLPEDWLHLLRNNF